MPVVRSIFFDDRPHTLLGSSDISPQCNEDGLPISYELSAGDISKDSDRVGELKRFCIRSTWSELTRFLTGGTWSNREENSSLERERARYVCRPHYPVSHVRSVRGQRPVRHRWHRRRQNRIHHSQQDLHHERAHRRRRRCVQRHCFTGRCSGNVGAGAGGGAHYPGRQY